MRLLHPGAHTRDIIQMYVHLVRSLQEMDPSGVVLSRVVSPLRRYLRGRKDTVLVIVASMLGDDPDFTLLKDELERADQEEQDQAEQTESKRRRRPRRSLQTNSAASGNKSGSKRSVNRRQPFHGVGGHLVPVRQRCIIRRRLGRPKLGAQAGGSGQRLPHVHVERHHLDAYEHL